MVDDFGVTHLPPLPPAGNTGDSKENPYAREVRRRKKRKKGEPETFPEEGPGKKGESEPQDETPSGKVLDILI
jgi:hypothetical protein